MYRPYSNAVLDYCMHHWREDRSGQPALPRDDLRALVRALRHGHAIWYAPDQTLDPRISVFAPFFGVPVSTIRSEEHTSELQSLMRISYAVFCLIKKITHILLFLNPFL